MNPERIEQLRNPAVFPQAPDAVEIVQTHLSVVCLVGDFVYKLKKPLRLPFADFSTLEKRRHCCEEEVRLNRRLCPQVYLGVADLRRDPEGRLSFDPAAEGEVIDCAVRMRRLPAGRMLDVLLEQDAVSVADIETIAARMAAFHHAADRGPEIAALGDPDKLRDFALANFTETRAVVGTVFHAELHAALESRARADFERWLPTLRRRVEEGRVVDGHGDLHARNICLTDPVAIYDCIEFNAEFRCGDVATEHAFLLMDLRYRSHPQLAAAYLDAVTKASGDEEGRLLMPTLLRYRAMVRAKVSAISAAEEELPAEQRRAARDSARRHLRLAAVSAIEEDGPCWLMLCGLPASGKSSIAEALVAAGNGSWPVFSSDRIRKELAGVAPADALPERWYRLEFSRRTYDALRSRAVAASRWAPVVVLDANFREPEERARARAAAESAGARLVILWIAAEEATVVARLDHRRRDSASVSDADHAVYQKLKTACVPPDSGEADRLIRVNGDLPAREAVDDLLAALLAG